MLLTVCGQNANDIIIIYIKQIEFNVTTKDKIMQLINN